jgi:hypothetical protein
VSSSSSGNEIIKIPISDTIGLNSNFWKVYHDRDRDFLYYFNHPRHEIIKFDLMEKKQVLSVPLVKEGPEGIKYVVGLSILSSDSILVGSFDCKLFLVNEIGSILRKIDYCIEDSFGNSSTPANITSTMMSDVYRIGKDLYIPQRPLMRNSEGALVSNESRLKSHLFVRYSEQNGGSEFLGVTLPKDFFTNSTTSMIDATFTSVWVDSTVYWGFKNRPTLYYSKLSMNSDTIGKIIPDNYNGDVYLKKEILDPFETLVRYAYFRSLSYSPFRKRFYRIFKPEIDPANWHDIPIEHLARYPNKFSIFVYDQDFHLIRELQFRGNKYDFTFFFVGRDGFYLSLNNPLNSEFDESYLQFLKIDI